MHSNPPNALLFVGALALSLGIVIAVKALLQNRGKKSAQFRNYFCTDFDCDLLELGSLSDDEDDRADHHSSFAPLRLRQLGADQRRM